MVSKESVKLLGKLLPLKLKFLLVPAESAIDATASSNSLGFSLTRAIERL